VRTRNIGSLNRQERSRERALFEVRDSCRHAPCARTFSRPPLEATAVAAGLPCCNRPAHVPSSPSLTFFALASS
jgi:hypothetical protein